MNKIRFGILGSGFMGRTHIEAIRRLPNAEVVAVTAAPALPASPSATASPANPTTPHSCAAATSMR